MRIKVLELDWWMKRDGTEPKRERLLGSKRYPEIRPVFNRPGIYRLGKEAWVEIGGKAYRYDPLQFYFQLAWKHALEYTDEEANALAAIAGTKFATERQRRLHYDIRTARESRNIRRNSRKHMMGIFRK